MAPHKHAWREIAWSLEAPLAVLMVCALCPKTQAIRPRKRLRKVPEGMTPERFEQYKAVAEDELLRDAFHARIASATDSQRSEAVKRNILPPLPTLETLDDYLARTDERQRKAA